MPSFAGRLTRGYGAGGMRSPCTEVPGRRIVLCPLTIVHGFARRLLMFELPDQLMLGSVQRARDVAVVGDGHQRRETRQGRPQRDALLPAAAVLPRDFQ